MPNLFGSFFLWSGSFLESAVRLNANGYKGGCGRDEGWQTAKLCGNYNGSCLVCLEGFCPSADRGLNPIGSGPRFAK